MKIDTWILTKGADESKYSKCLGSIVSLSMVFENVKMKELTAVQQWDGQQSSQRSRVGQAGWKCRDKESESDKYRNEKGIGTMSHCEWVNSNSEN